MKRKNEANAVKALEGILPFVTGGRYKNEGSPDEKSSQQKEVDYILTPDFKHFAPLAVEHTIVEAFRGQNTYVRRSYEIVGEVNDECKGRLPLDRYYILVVPYILVESLRKQAIRKFVEFIAPWVVTTAHTLSIEDHRILKYDHHDVLLMCGGSHNEINGTIGRIPGRPKDQKDLALQSLWLSITHGLGKFSKYKRLGHDTILSLEDISGEIYPSMLLGIEMDPEKKVLISTLVDYIIVFASNDDRMIVANVWKEKQLRYNPVPFNRRFGNKEGEWVPYE